MSVVVQVSRRTLPGPVSAEVDKVEKVEKVEKDERETKAEEASGRSGSTSGRSQSVLQHKTIDNTPSSTGPNGALGSHHASSGGSTSGHTDTRAVWQHLSESSSDLFYIELDLHSRKLTKCPILSVLFYSICPILSVRFRIASRLRKSALGRRHRHTLSNF